MNKHVVVAASAPLSQQPGYYCDVCDCTLRDSINYLDHINGKRRTRAARRETLDTTARFEPNSRSHLPKPSSLPRARARPTQAGHVHARGARGRRHRPRAAGGTKAQEGGAGQLRYGRQACWVRGLANSLRCFQGAAWSSSADFDARVEAAKREEEERKRAKKAKTSGSGDEGRGDNVNEDAGGVDPEMAAMMGFASFGGSKK